ncbi:MAG: UDP-N-acetylmuramoyl-L-alanine--D-glutamate ligase [Clostridiales bacterium]|nr:UDP-N-acetylmuramoyl-L-alanine--D-glutamate ligase [Clostridiales bacterium]
MIIENKRFLVYGSGVSGLSAYEFLKNKGGEVYIYTDKKNDNLNGYNQIEKFAEVLKIKFDYVIVSPGINILGNKNLKRLRKQGCLLMSELELGYLFCKGKFVAVTGTNGKTTCVHLINHVMQNYTQTFLCGNIGIPITSICDKTSENCVVVCEISSFMLELMSQNFKPDVAVILNITPDHISRHKTFENYQMVKESITSNQDKNDYLLLPKELKSLQTNANKIVIEIKKYKSNLLGEFNRQNIAFCEMACELLGVDNKKFKKHLKTFLPINFRLQNVGKKKGITYINDSKSTNPDSCIKALEGFSKPVVLLLGGSDKGTNFKQIFSHSNKIKLAIIYGETANKLEQDALFCGFSKTARFASLKESLVCLHNFVRRGDIVLFSPACASFDEFKNYIERGKFFNEYVNRL